MRMKDDGYFLLPPSAVRQFDECVANADYDGGNYRLGICWRGNFLKMKDR